MLICFSSIEETNAVSNTHRKQSINNYFPKMSAKFSSPPVAKVGCFLLWGHCRREKKERRKVKCCMCFGFLAKSVPWLDTVHHSSESITVDKRTWICRQCLLE